MQAALTPPSRTAPAAASSASAAADTARVCIVAKVARFGAALLVLTAGAAQAQYKCTAGGGSVTYQQAACPNTQTQQIVGPQRARPAVAEVQHAAPKLPDAPAKPPGERPAAIADREREAREINQALTNIEASFERLRVIQRELDVGRGVAAK